MTKCKLREDLVEQGLSVDIRLLDLNHQVNEGEKWLKDIFPEDEVYYDYLQSDFELNDAGHTLIIAHKGRVFTSHSIDFNFNDQIKGEA